MPTKMAVEVPVSVPAASDSPSILITSTILPSPATSVEQSTKGTGKTFWRRGESDGNGAGVWTNEMGKNEKIFREKYEEYVNVLIQRETGNLNIYYSMSELEKKQAIGDVNALLSGMTDGLPRDATITARQAHCTTSAAIHLDDQSFLFSAGMSENHGDSEAMPTTLFQTQAENSFDYCGGEDDLQHPDHEHPTGVRLLKSPDTVADETGKSISRQDDSIMSADLLSDSTDNQSCSPVELARRNKGGSGSEDDSSIPLSPAFQSTPLSGCLTNKKRLATTSGKKGADARRVRASCDDVMSPGNESEQINSPSQLLGPSVDSLPDAWNEPSPSFLAAASQSPIKKNKEMENSMLCLGAGSAGSSNPRRSLHIDVELGEERSGCSRRCLVNDTIESVNCTILPRRARNRDGKGLNYDDDAPADIRLKNGSFYHLDPLRVRRPPKHRSRRRSKSADGESRQNRPLLSIPDPFSSFHERLAGRLSVVADWIIERDGQAENRDGDATKLDDTAGDDGVLCGKGVLISMSLPHITAVTLKLLLANGANPHRRKYDFIQESKKNKALKGGTLMILRKKSDVEEWERSLRERTSFSVLNHSSLPSTERKRSKMRQKCAGFDVVLTTYDAIKARETILALDYRGRAVMKDESQDGWYSSRSSSGSEPQKCETLSVLQGMKWHRIIFIDLLGRAGYIAKPGTARATAAIALRSQSRFIFFACATGGTGVLEEKLREDRKQLCSIASALHLPEERAVQRVVGNVLLDMKDVQETANETFLEESFCS